MQNQYTGILADHQIRALCEVPVGRFVVNKYINGENIQIENPIYKGHVDDLGTYFQKIRERHNILDVSTTFTEFYKEEKIDDLKHFFKPMVTPYEPGQVRTRSVLIHSATDGIENDVYHEEKIISYGTSSFGYDLRLGHKYRVFTNMNATIIDPKNYDDRSFVDVEVPEIGGKIIVPPNSFILGYSLEYLRIPNDLLGIVLGKSTIARMGIDCLCTPLEPGWEGHVTLEFSNSSPLPAVLYVGEGCCQVIFHRGQRPDVTYGDRGGKYQNQIAEPVAAKV